MKQIVKSHFFWKHTNGRYSFFEKSKDELYSDITAIVRFSYLFFLLVLFVHLFGGNRAGDGVMYNPLWPVVFFKDVPASYLYLFFHVNLFIAFLSLCLYPAHRFLRVYAFVVYFLYAAFLNSSGKINHSLHLLLMMLFCFIFIPKQTINQYKEKTILIFATAQFFLLGAYSLTGGWKLFWGIIEFFTKEVSLFSPLSFRNVLIVQHQAAAPTIAGEFLLNHYIAGWILYLAVVFIELFSLYAFFKPNLHRLWGILLLSLHFGIQLILDVNMFVVPLYIGMLLLMSPFYKKTGFKTTLLSLPILSEMMFLMNRIRKKA